MKWEKILSRCVQRQGLAPNAILKIPDWLKRSFADELVNRRGALNQGGLIMEAGVKFLFGLKPKGQTSGPYAGNIWSRPEEETVGFHCFVAVSQRQSWCLLFLGHHFFSRALMTGSCFAHSPRSWLLSIVSAFLFTFVSFWVSLFWKSFFQDKVEKKWTVVHSEGSKSGRDGGSLVFGHLEAPCPRLVPLSSVCPEGGSAYLWRKKELMYIFMLR